MSPPAFTMSWDLQSKKVCNHYVNGVRYLANECTRCSGSGLFFDISPDQTGSLVRISGSQKLSQSIEKAFLETKRNSGWGFRHGVFVGQYDAKTIRTLLKSEVIATLSYLKQQQLELVRTGISMNDNEIIDRAGDLSITNDPSDPRRWIINIKVITVARKEVVLSFPLQLNTIPN